MLTLRANGVDLSLVPPDPVTTILLSETGTPYTITVEAVESDASLTPIYLSGTIDWNDGIHVTMFPFTDTVNGTLAMSATQFLTPGYHNISVYVHNYRAPVLDEVQVNYSVTVEPANAGQNTLRYLYGPILPKDFGFPNAQQWNFNLDADSAVLASSVKMLMETQIGERVMVPDYGTDIRAVLFEPNLPGVEAMIQEKLIQALTRWEPRVSIASVAVNRNSNRSVTVYVSLVSRLSQQPFQVTSTFNQ